LGFNNRLGISSPSDRLLMFPSTEGSVFSMDLLNELQRSVSKRVLLEEALTVCKLALSLLVLISCVAIIFSRNKLKLDICEQEIYKTEVVQVYAL
jgi:hypothetical protein